MVETKMKRASVPARPDQKVRYSPYPVYWIVGGYWFRSNTKGRRRRSVVSFCLLPYWPDSLSLPKFCLLKNTPTGFDRPYEMN